MIIIRQTDRRTEKEKTDRRQTYRRLQTYRKTVRQTKKEGQTGRHSDKNKTTITQKTNKQIDRQRVKYRN
jgi:hypothetical protein